MPTTFEKPIISIYVPSIRPSLWKRLYDSLLLNRTPFEVIFVGPITGRFQLPKNVRYICTSVKPSQCAEIGLRSCIGQYCIFAQDDIVFSKKALDILYETAKEKGDQVVVSCYPCVNYRRLQDSYYRFFPVDDKDTIHKKDSPIVPLCGIYKKSVLMELGGIDRNFICSCWDIDLAMRFYEKGGQAIFHPDALANEIVVPKEKRLAAEGKKDRTFLESLWTMTHEEFKHPTNVGMPVFHIDNNIPIGVIVKTRRKPFTPFTEENIMTISQDPKGRWQ
jgi:hypothetical protein